MKRSIQRCVLMALLAAVLAGCTGLAKFESDGAVDAHRRATAHLAANAQAQDRGNDGVTVKDGFWITRSSVRLAKSDPLPEVFSSKTTFNRRVKSLSSPACRPV
jgi:hypothetical protein